MNAEYSTIVQKPNKWRIIAIVTGLFISLPLCTYLFFSASSFFARASDEVPRDVTISHISKSSAIVVWTTDKETLSVVEYGLSPNELTLYGPELESKNEHEVELTLLTPGRTYYFQIRNGEVVYDNAGVPWTFTTRTVDGADPLEEVKGVMTGLTPMLTKKPDKNSTSSSGLANKCDTKNCDEIKKKLGQGCSAIDYLSCISDKTSVKTDTQTINLSTPIPTPTSVLIVSNLCKINILQAGSDCTNWRWESMETKPIACQEAFDRYILQCKNKSFSSSSTDPDEWYLLGAVTNISSNSAPLWKTPPNGSTVYCRLKAVDAEGSDTMDSHSTAWINAEKKCEY